MTRTVGDRVYRVLVLLYLGGILSANATAAKLVAVGSLATVTVGALAIPLVYSVLDLLNELYGKAVAREVVWMGFWANMVLVLHGALVLALPAAPIGASQEAFAAVFGVTWRVVLASQTAYLVASMLDVSVFSYVRQLTHGRHLWLRQSAGVGLGQFVDSSIFVTLAFAGVVPWRALPAMVFGEYVVKIVASPLRTAVSYIVLRRLR